MGAFEYSMLHYKSRSAMLSILLQFVAAADKYLETGKTVRGFRR